jgi:hypothetical protein
MAMIRTAITLAMLLSATAAQAQTVIEKLCIVTAAQDLPHVPGLEIKASRITTAPADYLGNQDMKYFGAEIDVVAAGQNHDLCVCLRNLAAAADIYAVDRDCALKADATSLKWRQRLPPLFRQVMA